MLSSTDRLLKVHYKNHVDEFEFNINKSTFTMLKCTDEKLFICSYKSYFGFLTVSRIYNDLYVGDLYHRKFFEKCKKLLYVTESNSWNDDKQYIHYINFDNQYVGRCDSWFKIKEYFIICDGNLCITDGQDVCVLEIQDWSIRVDTYYAIEKMDIDYIEIYPDVCRIYTPDESYIVSVGGLVKVENPELSLFPQSSMKSARSI